jgi:hypothetical protein
MSSTTIKLDGAVASRLRKLKGRNETLTGYVRGVLEAEIRRREMQTSARLYTELLATDPEEAAEVDAWQAAPLDRPARKRGKR